jgi:hypothetical protein
MPADGNIVGISLNLNSTSDTFCRVGTRDSPLMRGRTEQLLPDRIMKRLRILASINSKIVVGTSGCKYSLSSRSRSDASSVDTGNKKERDYLGNE